MNKCIYNKLAASIVVIDYWSITVDIVLVLLGPPFHLPHPTTDDEVELVLTGDSWATTFR